MNSYIAFYHCTIATYFLLWLSMASMPAGPFHCCDHKRDALTKISYQWVFPLRCYWCLTLQVFDKLKRCRCKGKSIIQIELTKNDERAPQPERCRPESANNMFHVHGKFQGPACGWNKNTFSVKKRIRERDWVSEDLPQSTFCSVRVGGRG